MLTTRIELTGAQIVLQLFNQHRKSHIESLDGFGCERANQTGTVSQKMQAAPLLYQSSSQTWRNSTLQTPDGSRGRDIRFEILHCEFSLNSTTPAVRLAYR
ncbi:Uncharacterised protein [Serratia fonticola]|nr:Uncharacterised protein [Serratia fonticola]